jgi:hypothetical protein
MEIFFDNSTAASWRTVGLEEFWITVMKETMQLELFKYSFFKISEAYKIRLHKY